MAPSRVATPQNIQNDDASKVPFHFSVAPNSSNVQVEAPDKEALVKRNPHGNWEEVQASRSDYDPSHSWALSKTPAPGWKPGMGATSDEWKEHELLSIDPHEEGRAMVQNYKLMISTCLPRPIAFVSTVNKEGLGNLSPFSYWNCVSTDPPLYSVSFVGTEANDSLRNVLETKELSISLISDWFIEAANYTSVNTPPHISEWPLSGLHAVKSERIAPPHIAEAAFSVECKLHSYQDIIGKAGVRTATLVLAEAVMFHVRKDVIEQDAQKATADLKKLRPIWRAGGITYGTAFQGFELPRPAAWVKEKEGKEVTEILEKL